LNASVIVEGRCYMNNKYCKLMALSLFLIGSAISAAPLAAVHADSAAQSAAHAAGGLAPSPPMEVAGVSDWETTREYSNPSIRIQITATEGDLDGLIALHRKKCSALKSRCRITAQQIRGEDGSGSALLRLIAPAAEAKELVQQIAAEIGDAGFSMYREAGRQSSVASSTRVEREMLLAQHKALIALAATASPEEANAIAQRVATLTASLRRMDVLAAPTRTTSPDLIGVEISYSAPSNYRSRDWDQMKEMFEKSILISLSVALITVLYLGVIGFGLLGLRKLAIKTGLLKDRLPCNSITRSAASPA